ncbi:hypothetical protein SSP531S_56440 [Streptomyces spongiicola]|uniref:Uncharacterized protein n=1 Tax=Streptomyces spongiicola TaxID=1690221 RepID=A0A388T788_9ACTN|nr:DUF6251 family protein [Streptomyces spongiicola]GBQ04152.1 hypothetical protein SSP531S_56440 [Streptomyces spongiicola]
MESLPEPTRVVQLPDGTHVYLNPAHPAAPHSIGPRVVGPEAVGPRVVHQHVHQAPPDRTVQRLALGTGIGAGTVAAGVYFGPLLVGVLTAMAANLALLALLAAVCAWGVVTVVRSVGGPDGKQAARNARRTRRRR